MENGQSVDAGCQARVEGQLWMGDELQSQRQSQRGGVTATAAPHAIGRPQRPRHVGRRVDQPHVAEPQVGKDLGCESVSQRHQQCPASRRPRRPRPGPHPQARRCRVQHEQQVETDRRWQEQKNDVGRIPQPRLRVRVKGGTAENESAPQRYLPVRPPRLLNVVNVGPKGDGQVRDLTAGAVEESGWDTVQPPGEKRQCHNTQHNRDQQPGTPLHCRTRIGRIDGFRHRRDQQPGTLLHCRTRIGRIDGFRRRRDQGPGTLFHSHTPICNFFSKAV